MNSFQVSRVNFDTRQLVLNIAVSGMVDTNNAIAFRQAVMGLVAENCELRQLRIECSGLGYLSSTGIGAVLDILTHLRRLHVGVVFVSLPQSIQNVIALLGFLDKLELE